ncbi:DUF4192 domain-containing protein [Actinomycetospora termitidis]|uniref:DUF4192 domain-containing protein n=1 Tax=Actinomycetospora termitidis TaxID=3053470 RepID=A0ABT7MJL8_9PSEU|nr:DUF4192 domain-containing protein [Actinomycetospora sp. Odt1-22]MDL5160409.1 DUF4192 domain-containing protein [Actinomycetospora sp. Odt1-22]
MTQEAAPQTVVRINRPETLLASLPALFGFTPAESLVVICLKGETGRRRVDVTIRFDLPVDREGEWELLRYAHGQIGARRPDAVHIAVVGGHLEGIDLPHTWMIDRLTSTIRATGTEVIEPMWAPAIRPGAAWACYAGCCAGTLPDPTGTEVAAHRAISGRRMYLDRDDATAAIDPDAAATGPARRQVLDDALAASVARRAGHGANRAAREDLDALRAACARTGRGEPVAEPDLMAMVASLIDPRVRDVALGFVVGCDDTVDPGHAVTLWQLLTRAAPAPEVAEPATLAAFAAMCTGGGPVMSAALHRARSADPEHTLSLLLTQAIEHGMDPEILRTFAVNAATETAATVDF